MDKNICPRPEFPNPCFERQNWLNLNGVWDFAFDFKNVYEKKGVDTVNFDREIMVPFCYESKMSGIGIDEPCENIWYRRSFILQKNQLGGSVLLKFGAVDYVSKVWVNGTFVGSHEGGFTPFSLEIAHLVHEGENQLVVKVEDSYSKEIPRGKQMWAQKPDLCWYTNTSGIWQTVWIEFTGNTYITRAHITPNIDSNMAYFDISLSSPGEFTILAELSVRGKKLGTVSANVKEGKTAMSFTFEDYGVRSVFELYWSPKFPVLIDVHLILLENGERIDAVSTYFGMRKIHVENDRIYLNNEPLYQRLVLDQGYWPDSLMTPPDDEAIKKDVEMTKELGFNGARKHQKIEDPRYYYWADKIGVLVWGELPAAFDFTFQSRRRLINEMGEFIGRDYNHPSIISWVPINESWGVHRISGNKSQKDFARTLYYFIKTNDPLRLVISNDGWEQLEINDICGIHDYEITPENAQEKYKDVMKLIHTNAQFKAVYAEHERYNGVPIMVTEYGGIKLAGEQGWGYLNDARNSEELLRRIEVITNAIRENREICGFCYTQLTDVVQETNGLLDAHRNPRLTIEAMHSIFG